MGTNKNGDMSQIQSDGGNAIALGNMAGGVNQPKESIAIGPGTAPTEEGGIHFGTIYADMTYVPSLNEWQFTNSTNDAIIKINGQEIGYSDAPYGTQYVRYNGDWSALGDISIPLDVGAKIETKADGAELIAHGVNPPSDAYEPDMPFVKLGDQNTSLVTISGRIAGQVVLQPNVTFQATHKDDPNNAVGLVARNFDNVAHQNGVVLVGDNGISTALRSGEFNDPTFDPVVRRRTGDTFQEFKLLHGGNVSNELSIGDLSDVDLSVAPSVGQVLVWDNTNTKFVPGDVSGNDLSIGDLTDVDMSIAPTDGQLLVWDDANTKFVPGDVNINDWSIGDLNDVDMSIAPTDGQVLVWDDANTKFVPGTSDRHVVQETVPTPGEHPDGTIIFVVTP